MSQNNQKTLETYQQNFARYVDGTVKTTTPNDFVGSWILGFLSRIPSSGRILEIGSAFGRDAQFMHEQGYENLDITDAFDAAVDYLNAHGLSARKLNIVTDDPEEIYDGIFANAVFLHLSEAEFSLALQKCREHLKSTGFLAFSLKKGHGEKWSSEKVGAPRYFHYWQVDGVRQLLSAVGLKVVAEQSGDEKWLQYIVEKI